MNVVHRPLVVLIARPVILEDGINLALADYGDDSDWFQTTTNPGERLTEFAGRVCYASFGNHQGRKDSAAYLRNMIAHRHGSVMEHATYSFFVGRVSRYYTHEQVRHRAGFAYSQESTRFVRYDGGATLVIPEVISGASRQHIEEDAKQAIDTYRLIMDQLESDFGAKAVSTAARHALPGALATRIVVTANVRALRYFCQLRGAEDAAPEIRCVAADMLAILRRECPTLFGDMEASTGEDGYPVVTGGEWKV